MYLSTWIFKKFCHFKLHLPLNVFRQMSRQFDYIKKIYNFGKFHYISPLCPTTPLHHQTTLRHAGTFYPIMKNTVNPLFHLQSSNKKISIEVSNVNLCLFTALMLLNLIVVVIKTSEINFQLLCHAGTT